jgi:hypothetical protein
MVLGPQKSTNEKRLAKPEKQANREAEISSRQTALVSALIFVSHLPRVRQGGNFAPQGKRIKPRKVI